MVQAKLMRAAVVVTLLLPMAGPASAQYPVTARDIQRLQDTTYDIGDELGRIGDSRDADRLSGELDTLREEVIYLKVKLRKEGSVQRSEYVWLHDRLQDLKRRANAPVGSGQVWPISSGVK